MRSSRRIKYHVQLCDAPVLDKRCTMMSCGGEIDQTSQTGGQAALSRQVPHRKSNAQKLKGKCRCGSPPRSIDGWPVGAIFPCRCARSMRAASRTGLRSEASIQRGRSKPPCSWGLAGTWPYPGTRRRVCEIPQRGPSANPFKLQCSPGTDAEAGPRVSYQWNARRSLDACNKVAAIQQPMEPAMEMARTDIHMGVLPMSV
jgi:hypothetical protein